jgi:ubiquinone/menaquinone biosynthesis C-methylase UbiE
MNELFDNDSLLVNGRTLQVACVYSDFTQSLAKRLLKASSSLSFDVVDVIPDQLENLKRKLPNAKNVTLTCNDAQDLQFRNETFHRVVLFFLLHEMPNEVRIQTLRQAMRVLQPGGKLVILDYHEPHSWYWKSIMSGMFRLYEPFAKDLWKHEVEEWLPTSDEYQYNISKEEYFDGLYQKVVVRKDSSHLN